MTLVSLLPALATFFFAQMLSTAVGSTSSGRELRAVTRNLITSDTPVVFANFTRGTEGSVNRKPRTDPFVFQRALELKSGRPFNFRVDKWRKLVNSKLFKGLSAHIAKDPFGRAYILISGQELPSVTFSPEVSAGLHELEPDVSGGISYEDKNLLGLGQTLSIALSTRDANNRFEDLSSIVGSTSDIFSQLKIRWEDFCVGQKPKVVITYDEDVTKETPSLISPKNSGIVSSEQASYKTSRTAVKFIDEFVFRWPRIQQAEVEMEPYFTTLKPTEGANTLDRVNINGAKFSIGFSGKRSLRLWLDHGVSVLKTEVSKFNQLGADIAWPEKLLKTFKLPFMSLLLRNASNEVDVVGSLEAKAMMSSGPGRVPIYHHSDLGSEKILRGYPASPPASTYAALKGDVLFATDFPLIPGTFFDAAVFKNADSDDNIIRHKCTLGFSMRAMGFLVELGWPLFNGDLQLKSPVRVYFGIDSPSSAGQ